GSAGARGVAAAGPDEDLADLVRDAARVLETLGVRAAHRAVAAAAVALHQLADVHAAFGQVPGVLAARHVETRARRDHADRVDDVRVVVERGEAFPPDLAGRGVVAEHAGAPPLHGGGELLER